MTVDRATRPASGARREGCGEPTLTDADVQRIREIWGAASRQTGGCGRVDTPSRTRYTHPRSGLKGDHVTLAHNPFPAPQPAADAYRVEAATRLPAETPLSHERVLAAIHAAMGAPITGSDPGVPRFGGGGGIIAGRLVPTCGS